jgi:hypothetical protein
VLLLTRLLWRQAHNGKNYGYSLAKEVVRETLSMFNELEDPTGPKEEKEELRQTMEYCLKAFLLFLVGVTVFADKSNKHISLIWLEGMRNLYRCMSGLGVG